MRHVSEKKTIAFLLCISIFLLTLGLYTAFASITFANPKQGLVTYDVYFSEVSTNKDVENKVIVNNNRIDLGVTFKMYGEEVIAHTTLNNDGNVDTKLVDFLTTNLQDIVVGRSEYTGNTYTLYDYISYQVYYEYDSEINDIKTPQDVQVGDMLRKNTSNNIVIKVQLKNDYSLSKDQKYVFEKVYGHELNVNIFLEATYLEA